MKTLKTLDELAKHYGTDKGIWGYLPHYTRELEPKRDRVKAVLEIGICGERDIPSYKGPKNVTGASLLMWRDYFPNACVVGIDIDARWMVTTEERVSTHVGDQGNPYSLKRCADLGLEGSIPWYDLIVDDAVHDPSIQLCALHALLPYLAPDGLYVIEDVCPYKLPGGRIEEMTRWIPPEYTCEVIATHKPERLLFIKHRAP